MSDIGSVDAISIASSPSSTDSRDGEKGGAGSRTKRARTQAIATSASPADEGGEGATKRPYTQRAGNGHRDIGDILCKPWDDVSRELMGNSKSVGAEQVKKYEGSFDKATANRVDTMTFTKLVDILAEGLTEDGIGQFAVVPGKVFFKSAKLGSLKFWYNKNAKYNPADVGVDLNKTQVKIASVVYTVRSVEEGMYSLSDCDIKIDQWQLLECRYTKDEEKDNALVTLENDLQKYILSLVAIYTIVWTSFVQFY